jgi:hypothetical protein
MLLCLQPVIVWSRQNGECTTGHFHNGQNRNRSKISGTGPAAQGGGKLSKVLSTFLESVGYEA